MTNQSSDINTRRPWARTGFDIEGWVFALAAVLMGFYAGTLWYPLFVLGILAAMIILAATRTVERSIPDGDFRVLAPCDGVVSSVSSMLSPSELGLAEGERVRVRISSSPFSPNPLFAPITGPVSTSSFDEGDPSRIFASDPDAGGLEVSYLTIGSGRDAVGLKIMTAGLGPRLDVETEAGDLLRAGRKFAKRRLGGWCDVYLPAGMEPAVWPGQTIVGAETELSAISDTWIVKNLAESEESQESLEEAEPKEEIDLEKLGTTYSSSNVDDAEMAEEPEELTSKLFEKLRREAQGLDED